MQHIVERRLRVVRCSHFIEELEEQRIELHQCQCQFQCHARTVPRRASIPHGPTPIFHGASTVFPTNKEARNQTKAKKRKQTDDPNERSRPHTEWDGSLTVRSLLCAHGLLAQDRRRVRLSRLGPART